jgi:hypothetical protein
MLAWGNLLSLLAVVPVGLAVAPFVELVLVVV